jgi:hypothetical protein
VPRPGALSTVSVAPTAAARSRMPTSPQCPSGAARPGTKPHPSSRTRIAHPVAAGRAGDGQRATRRVLPRVHERFRGDPEQLRLDGGRARARGPVCSTSTSTPVPAKTRRAVSPSCAQSGTTSTDDCRIAVTALPRLVERAVRLIAQLGDHAQGVADGPGPAPRR